MSGRLMLPVQPDGGARHPAWSWGDRLLGLLVSPYVILAVVGATAVSLAASGALDVALWLVLIATAAGWSSAWSP